MTSRDHFAGLGLELANRPYPTPEGPEYYARLLWPDGSWKPKLTEHVGREFAISLERETFSHCGTMTRHRPLAELPAYLRTCGIPNRTSEAPKREGEEESEGHAKSTTPAQAAIPLTDLRSDVARDVGPVECGSDSSPPSPPAAGEASFLDECRSKGIEVNPVPLTAEGITFVATYRGKRFHVYPKSRSAMFGYRIPLGRRWEPQTLDEALRAIDAELDGPRVPKSHPELPLSGGLSPVRPATPETGESTQPESPRGAAAAADMPARDERPLNRPPGQRDRLYETRHSIERIGGKIAPGVRLRLLTLTRPGHGNFARLDGQRVLSDVSLDRFTEVCCG